MLRQPALLVGTKIAAGVATKDVAKPIGTQAQADKEYGTGSELAFMFRSFFANNFAHEVWGLPVDEPVGASAATGTITVATAQTEAGVISLYIGGHKVPVTIGATDTTTQVATKIASAINGAVGTNILPVTATAATATVTLTARTKGINGNDISVTHSYYGKVGGEELPVGMVLTLPATGQLTGGAGIPIYDTAIANLGEQEFEYVALPHTDSTTLLAWETEYGFSDTGRWGWMRQHFGHLFASKRDTYANLITFGQSRNQGVTSVMAVELTSPSPQIEWTAAYCAKAARALLNDPARPLQTLSLNRILPAPINDLFIWQELNSMAQNGLATQKKGSDNQPMIARESTTYRLNLYSQPDDAYELVTTLATLARLLRNQRHAITSKFPRHKLADDGTRFGPGQAIVTPNIIRAELVAQYRIDEFNGLVENVREFKNHLIVERDPNDPNRVNVLYPPDLVNQLRIFAVLAQFRLQYNRGQDLEVAATQGART